MAKKKAAKKTSKKTKDESSEAADTTAAPKERKKSERKKEGRGIIVHFMTALINAGYLGDELPEDSKERNRAAQNLRQMAEKLARQTRKLDGDALPPGGEESDEDDEDEEGEDKE